MTQARAHTRSAPRKEARAEKVGVSRNATSGQYVHIQAGEEVAEVPVTKVRFRRIFKKKRAVGKVISGYADALAEASRTGYATTVSFLVMPDGRAQPVAKAKVPADSPLGAATARAKDRGATKIADILRGEDMLTAHDFGKLIGTTHTTVNTKRTRHEVLALAGATRGFRYPRWQITQDHLPLPGLVQLFDALGDQPWAVYRFLRTAHAELGGVTALDALKAGQVEAVLGVASNQAAGTFS